MKICLKSFHRGRLTQMMRLMDAFQGHEIFFITNDGLRSADPENKSTMKSLGKDPLGYLISMPKMILILLHEKPDIVISTGPEIAIPVFYIALVLGIKNFIYRAHEPGYEQSGTGKIVYPIPDVFFVHWKQQLAKYGNKTQYSGCVY